MMKYKIAVHPDVLDMMELLPAITRAKLISLFRSVMSYGLTSVGARHLHWNRDNIFTLSVTHNLHEVRTQNGAMVKGFRKDPFDGTFYISALFRMEEGECANTGQLASKLFYRNHPDPRDTGGYIALDPQWIGEQLENPFVRRAYKSTDSGLRVPVTAPMHIESNFFDSVDQVHWTMLNELDSGSLPPLPGAIADRVSYRVRFDADGGPKPWKGNLTAYLESLQRWPHTLVLVNFTDELDPLSMAQRGFFNLIPPFLRGQYPDLKIQIVDVVIRDLQGRKAYGKEFGHFARHCDTADQMPAGPEKDAPFTMVLGGPVERTLKVLGPVVDRNRRLLTIDLFRRCRGGAADSRATYKTNLRRAIHDLMRVAGLLTDRASVVVKDFRRRSEGDVSKAIVAMTTTSVVLVVRDDRDSGVFRATVAACAHVALSGFPYVSIIQADRTDDVGLMLTVNVRKGENWVYSDPPDDPIRHDDDAFILMLIEDIEEAYGRNPYLTEILEGKSGSTALPPVLI